MADSNAGSDNVESGGYRIAPYNSSGAKGMGSGSVSGTKGPAGVIKPYTSYGSDSQPSAEDADNPNPDALGGVSTNFPWDSSNPNPKIASGRPNSGGAVADPMNLSDADGGGLYQTGYTHQMANAQNPDHGKSTNGSIPADAVINRGYSDNGNLRDLATSNPAAIRQRLGGRTNGNSGKPNKPYTSD